MSKQFNIEDTVGAWLEVTKVSGQANRFERWQITESGVPWLTRAQLHQLHGALGEMLGLGIPTPSSPLTASRSGARLPGGKDPRPEIMVEKPDGSGDAARRV